MLSEAEIERYARHIVLPEIGGAGQQKLKAARVLVVGAGGLGAPVLLYLAAAGVGTLVIADDDAVSVSNLQRQVIHDTTTVAEAKTHSAADAIGRPDETLHIEEWTAPPRDASAMLRQSTAADVEAEQGAGATSPSGDTAPEPSTADDQVIEGTAEEVSVTEMPHSKMESDAPRAARGGTGSDESRHDGAGKEPAPELPAEPTDSKSTARTAESTASESPKADDARGAAGKPIPAVMVPQRPPDDPGVTPSDADESEVSLERFRTAHIR